MRKTTTAFLSIFAFAIICLSAGCGAPPPAKHYPLQGEVIAVDVPNKLITVKHGDIPGLMSAMTMQYVAADSKELATVQPGDKISADLVIGEDHGQLEKITVIGKPTLPAPPPAETPKKQ